MIDLLKSKRPDLAGYFDGKAHWTALLEIQKQSAKNLPRVQLKLHSDLRGVDIRLPAPLGKSAAEQRPLTIAWVPGNETFYPVQIAYGDALRASAKLRQPENPYRHNASWHPH